MTLAEEARSFAAIAHGAQMRRCGSEPYFNHPQRVAKAVEELYLSDEMALLMDVFMAGYSLGKEDGYTDAMADNDTLINP